MTRANALTGLAFRTIIGTDEYRTNLLCLKSRVAPLKKVILPQLELSAAVLLAQLIKKIADLIDLSKARIFLWSGYVNNRPQLDNVTILQMVSFCVSSSRRDSTPDSIRFLAACSLFWQSRRHTIARYGPPRIAQRNLVVAGPKILAIQREQRAKLWIH